MIKKANNKLRISVDQTAFIELLKESLFKITAIIPDDTNWDNVFDIAMQHRVVGLIEPCVPQKYKDKWTDVAYNSKVRFVQILYEQNKLIALLKANYISMVVLKGTAAAMYYPVPTNRAMGDIDFFVSPSEFSKASEVMSSNGYSFISDNGRHLVYEKHGVEFELHRRVSSELCKDIDDVVVGGLKHSVE